MGEMRSKAWSSQKISKYFQVCWAPTSAFWLYSCKITEEVKKYICVCIQAIHLLVKNGFAAVCFGAGAGILSQNRERQCLLRDESRKMTTEGQGLQLFPIPLCTALQVSGWWSV